MSVRVGILGASGLTGAELMRYLARHPDVELVWASSRRHANTPVAAVHPHLLGAVDLTFSQPEPVPALDLLFAATPHGTTASMADHLLTRADVVIDLSSDFRLRDAARYEATYRREHAAPHLLDEAAYGLAEVDRSAIAKANLIAGPGCLATSAILSLLPLTRAGLVGEGPITLDGKIGSTASGAESGTWSSHAFRVHTVRPYAPLGHRHEAEVRQEVFGGSDRPLWFSAHATDMTRGILQTAQVPLVEGTSQRDVHRAFLKAYNDEPFVTVLAGRRQPGGLPEPRFVAGTNNAHVAALARPDGSGAVVLTAIDNLGKGAAGSAVQAMNVRLGLPEDRGLRTIAAFP